MSDNESDIGLDDHSSTSSSPPTSVRSSVDPDKPVITPKSHRSIPHRVGTFPNIRGDTIEQFFSSKNPAGDNKERKNVAPQAVTHTTDIGTETLLRSLLTQTHNLLNKIGDVPGAIQSFQLILIFIRNSTNAFSMDLVMDILKFLKPLTRTLTSQPLMAVTLLEQANNLAERFGVVEYQIKFSLQMPLILLPEMDLQSDDTMKQLRRAVQECAAAHLLVTKYLARLQSHSTGASSLRIDSPLTFKIEKLSGKLNALLSTLEKMFLVYNASFISFHPHILQTIDPATIFHHYSCLEKLATHLLKRGDYERARALFPTKLSAHLIQHNVIYGHSLLKVNSEINLLECRMNGISLDSTKSPRKDAPISARQESNVLLDILNELEQDQIEQSSEYPKTQQLGSPNTKSQLLKSALKGGTVEGFEEAHFMGYRKAFAVARKQVPPTLLVADDNGNLDTNLVNRAQLKLTRAVRDIISMIVEDVLDLAGPPPCHFCIVGLGSHGRTEVAPYSDFEFALLLEKDMHDDVGEDDFINSYFGRFVEMMDFVVNCIGEPTGFRLDTQGTPKEYRFRGTPSQIVERTFKSLDAQGIPMAFSLLQPTCIYVGGPPKSMLQSHAPHPSAAHHAHSTPTLLLGGLTSCSSSPASIAGSLSPHSSLSVSTPHAGVTRAQTSIGLAHSSSIVAGTSPSHSTERTASSSSSTTPTPHTSSHTNTEVRKVSSSGAIPAKTRQTSNSRIQPPPLMISSSGSSIPNPSSLSSSFTPTSAMPHHPVPITVSSLPPLLMTPPSPSTPPIESDDYSGNPLDSSDSISAPLRRPSAANGIPFGTEGYSLFAAYQDLVISRLQNDIWKGLPLHASLARYCLQDHLKMMAPGKKWHRPQEKPFEVHLKDHFLTPLICFTHDIALYYLSHIPTVFPNDASATAHLMDSLAVANARTPVPIFASQFAASFREAWAALNAIRIRAELEYGEQIDAETPVYLEASAVEGSGVILTLIERYWLAFVEWVVQKPLYRVLPTFLEAMPSGTIAAPTQIRTSRNSANSTSRARPPRRSSLGTNPMLVPSQSSVFSDTATTTNSGSNNDSILSSAPSVSTFHAAGGQNSSSTSSSSTTTNSISANMLSSSLQSTSMLSSGISMTASSGGGGGAANMGSPTVSRARSGSDAPAFLNASAPSIMPDSSIEQMDPALYSVEQLLDQIRSGAKLKDISDWMEPVISLAWTLTLRHSSPRVHLSYYRAFPPEWRGTYYQTLEQLELVHAPLLEHVFDDIRSYADPSGSRLHNKPMDSLWREQVSTEVVDRLETALATSIETYPDIPLPPSAPNPRSSGPLNANSHLIAPSPKLADPSAPILSTTPISPSTTTNISYPWLPSKVTPTSITQQQQQLQQTNPIPTAATSQITSSTPAQNSPFGTAPKTLSIPATIPFWSNRKYESIQPKRLEGRVVETSSMIFYFPANLISSILEISANLFYRRIVFRGSAQTTIARLSLRRYLRELLEKQISSVPTSSSLGSSPSSTDSQPSSALEKNTSPSDVNKARKRLSDKSARERPDSTASATSISTSTTTTTTTITTTTATRNSPNVEQLTNERSQSTSLEQRRSGEKRKTITACFVVQRISGDSLGSVLHSNLEKLSMLDHQSFSDSFLAALLLPGVERCPDDYILQPYEKIDKDNNMIDSLRLVVSRQESPWGESAIMDMEPPKEGGSRELKVARNILFCLDQMREPLDPDSLFQFLDLDPVAVMTSWFKELKQTQARWVARFGSDIRKIFQPAPLQLGTQPDLLSLPDYVVPRLMSLMTKIQSTLRANHRSSHLDILKLIHPILGHVYGKAHQHPLSKPPLERFEEISNPWRVSSLYRLLPRSSDIQQFVPRATVNTLTVSELRVQLQTHIKESAMLADTRVLIMESFNLGRWELFHFNPQLQQRVLDALDSKELPIQVQTALFALIEQSHQRLNEITVRNSDVLDNALLDTLVRQSGGLITKLHLPGCQKLENRFIGGTDVVKLLADHCAGLTSLDLSGTNIKYFAVQQLTRTAEIKFERLEWLFLDHCRQLEKVKLNTPNLWHVDARHCSELVKFEANTGKSCATADLMGSKIGCAKLLMLCGLELSKSLSYLAINARRFQEIVEPLEQILVDSSRTRFEVSHKTLPQDFISILSAVIKLSSLSEIVLQSCEVDDESIKSLVDACLQARKSNATGTPTVLPTLSSSSSSNSSSPLINRAESPSDFGQNAMPKLRLSILHCRVAPSVQQEVLGRALGTPVFISFTD